MTNPLALGLALLIVAAVAADLVLTGGASVLFLARRFLDLLAWVAFWR